MHEMEMANDKIYWILSKHSKLVLNLNCQNPVHKLTLRPK